MKCAHEARDRLLITFRNNLHASVVKVAYEAAESLPMSCVFCEESEADPLNAALDEEPLGDNHEDGLSER